MDKVLYLVPTTLGGGIDSCVTDEARKVLRLVHHVIAESTKCAKRFIHEAVKDVDVDLYDYYEINEHTDMRYIDECLEPLKRGEAMVLMSDAGCPAVADPGREAVLIAHRKGYKVVPLAGASSIIMALMASGLNGQSFAFNGYLPVKKSEREKRIRELEARAWKEGQTQSFIETPYRANAMLESCINVLKRDTKLSISSELTTEGECCKTMTAGEWKKAGIKLLKVRAVFLIAK